jgi:hypothetical protein
MHAKNEAVDAFRAATERAAESGIAPHYDPRVIRASELVAETAVAVRAAAAAHEAAWGGRELYTLPAATQAEIERMTRQARFQELGGAKPNRAHHGAGSGSFGVVRGRRGTFDHGGAQVHGTFHPGVTVVDPHHFGQIDRGDAIVSDDPLRPFVWVRFGRGLEGHVYRYSTYRRQGPTWHRTPMGSALVVEEPKSNARPRRRR